MKLAKQKFVRLLTCALVFLLAFTAAVPAFAEQVNKENQKNLTITIKNNKDLPAMTAGQFTAYQIFTGIPNKETVPPETTQNDWEAKNWNNYSLADIQWGKNIKGDDLLAGLKILKDTNKAGTVWPGFFDADGKNIIKKYLESNNLEELKSAADLAALLVNQKNAFLQEFSRFVVEGSSTGEKLEEGVEGLLKEAGAKKSEVTYQDSDNPEDDESSITVDETGYYLIVENNADTKNAAVSEYILAVLGNQVINLKATVPQVDKYIITDGGDKKGDAAGVGDYVKFKLTATLPENFADFTSYKYVFHDTLSKGLEYADDASHKLQVRMYADQAALEADTDNTGGTLINENKTADPGAEKNYTVSPDGAEDPNPCSLEVSFYDLKTLSNDGSKTIEVTPTSVFVVTYYAQVTNDAVLISEGNPNTVLLEYSNNPNSNTTGKTKESIAYVYALGLDLKKIGSDKPNGLGGAGFVLKDKDNNYAIFKEQWVVNKTAENGKTTQTFYTSNDDAVVAAGVDGTVDQVRRLTGWTSATSTPTTDAVKGLIQDYKDKKKTFDNATNEEREPEGTAYNELESARNALEKYLLRSDDSDGAIPDVYGLDAGIGTEVAKYALEEVIVPDGYNSLKGDFDISIQAEIDDNNGSLKSVTYKHGTEAEVVYKIYSQDEISNFPGGETAAKNLIAHFEAGLVQDSIENQRAPILPFTGGVGRIIIYALGIALIAGVAVHLTIVFKKRKRVKENA